MESKDHITSKNKTAKENTVSPENNIHNENTSQNNTTSNQSSGSYHGRRGASHHNSYGGSKQKSIFKRIKSRHKSGHKKKDIQKKLIILNFALILVCFILWCVMMWAGNVFKKEPVSEQVPTDNSLSYPYYSGNSVTSVSQSIPSYWKTMIAEKTEVVKALQAQGGKDAISFVWASDTHIPDGHAGITKYLGRLMEKMLDDCQIPFAILSGDIGTRASLSTEEEYIASQKRIAAHLSPLWGTDRLLVALGNHDGTWGSNPNGDGVTGYYRYQYTPERLWHEYFRWQALDSRRVFSDDGLYFYVDDAAQKMRYIILNSQYGGEYSVDVYGWAVNDRFHTSCYGQAQLDWLADEALDMPEGYSAIITTHVPPKLVNGGVTPYTVDCDQLNGIINAYCNKTTFSGSYTDGIDGWSNSTVEVDFTDAKGEIIALFAGHIHQDTIDTETLACPIITIISAGADVNEGEAPERKFGTDTETSFDVVTINKKTRTIYCTRVGAGEDRQVQY